MLIDLYKLKQNLFQNRKKEHKHAYVNSHSAIYYSYYIFYNEKIGYQKISSSDCLGSVGGVILDLEGG